MDGERHFAVAPWPTSLKVSSLLGSLLLMGVGYAAYRAIPVPSGFTHYFGLGVALIPPLCLLGSLLTMVTGYRLSATELRVERLLSTTVIPLAGLQRIETLTPLCKGTVRIIGNAGLFGFTGLYQNQRLGRFRLFATDPRRGIALVMAERTVVVTPAAPELFVPHLQHLFPAVVVDEAPEGAPSS